MATFLTYKRWRLRDGVNMQTVINMVRDRIAPHYEVLDPTVRLGLEQIDGAQAVLATQRWLSRERRDRTVGELPSRHGLMHTVRSLNESPRLEKHRPTSSYLTTKQIANPIGPYRSQRAHPTGACRLVYGVLSPRQAATKADLARDRICSRCGPSRTVSTAASVVPGANV